MTYDDLPPDSMGLVITVLDDGELGITLLHNFSEGWTEEEAEPYMDILNGLNLLLSNATDAIGLHGAMARMIKDFMEEYEESSIDFEPADELVKATEDRKVIPFKKRLH